MHSFTLPRPVFRICLLAGGLLAGSAAFAVSPCKGMAQGACVADGACLWVDGYTRKDGRTVAAHCKLRSGRQSGQEAGAALSKPGSSE